MCVWIYRGKVYPEPRAAAEQQVQALQSQTQQATKRAMTQDLAAAGAATERSPAMSARTERVLADN